MANLKLLIIGIITSSKYTGIGVYLRELLYQLSKSDVNISLVQYSDAKFDHKSLSNKSLKRLVPYINKMRDILLIWSLLKSKMGNRTIVLFPNLFFLFKSTHPTIMVIHDLAEWDTFAYPILQRYFRRWMTIRAVKYATHIVAISNFTRDRILFHTNCDPKKIIVIKNGSNKLSQSDQTSRPSFHKKYFIYIGRISESKGFIDVLKAYRVLSNEIEDIPALHYVGPDSNKLKKNIKRILGNAYSFEIIDLGYMDEVQKADQLRHSIALLHPSHYEGHGLAVCEAKSINCAVIAADAEAVKEINGEYCYFYSKGNEYELAALMKQAILYGLPVKSSVEYNTRTWHETAKEYYELIKTIE